MNVLFGRNFSNFLLQAHFFMKLYKCCFWKNFKELLVLVKACFCFRKLLETIYRTSCGVKGTFLTKFIFLPFKEFYRNCWSVGSSSSSNHNICKIIKSGTDCLRIFWTKCRCASKRYNILERVLYKTWDDALPKW